MVVNQQKVFTEMLKSLGMAKDSLLIAKAGEIYDLIAIKANSTSEHLNDAAKTIMCIDISCELLNIPFDSQAGINQSSMRKNRYINSKKIYMKLMNLSKKLSINDLIMKRGISNPNVERTAAKIYESYKQQAEGADLDHPQWIAMSVYQACKLEKTKVAKKDFISTSNLKPIQWAQLEKSWDKFVASIGKFEKENVNNKPAKSEITLPNASDPKLKRKAEAEAEIEDYDVWAERVFLKARAEMEAMK